MARRDQFVAECREIIPAATGALAQSDLAAFGTLVNRSQHLTERGLRIQVDENRIPGALGAGPRRDSGLGLRMVETEQASGFLEAWWAGYLTRFPDSAAHAAFSLMECGPPTQRVV